MTLVLLPPSTDDEPDEQKCWREGTGDGSLAACHCGLSRMLGGRQPLSGDHLEERPCVRGQRTNTRWPLRWRKMFHAYLKRSFEELYDNTDLGLVLRNLKCCSVLTPDPDRAHSLSGHHVAFLCGGFSECHTFRLWCTRAAGKHSASFQLWGFHD